MPWTIFAPNIRPGLRHSPGRQHAARRTGHSRLQRRGPPGHSPAVRPLPLRRRVGLRRQLRVAGVRAQSGPGPADQRRWRGEPGVADRAARHPHGPPFHRLGVLRRPDGGYREDDPIDPVTVYGKTMAEGEQLLAAADPTACILRISLPMGVSFSGHAGAIDWITSRFKKSRPATLYFDEVRTPTYTDCMNELYEVMLSNRLSGIFHAGGPRKLTLYQIGQVINRAGGYDPDCLLGIPRREAGPLPPRAGNVAMDSSKLIRALGYNPFDPWPRDEALVPGAPDWHYHRGPDAPGSAEHLYRSLCSNAARVDAGDTFALRTGSATRSPARVRGRETRPAIISCLPDQPPNTKAWHHRYFFVLSPFDAVFLAEAPHFQRNRPSDQH